MQAQIQKKVTKSIFRIPKLRDIPVCLIMFLTSRASFMGVYPFAVAMFCAVFDKDVAYLAVAAMLAGSLSAGVGFSCVKYVLAAVFFWLFTCLRDDWRKSRVFSAVVCGCSLFSGGCILMIYDTAVVYDFVALAIESISAMLMYVVYSKAISAFNRRRTSPTRTETVALAMAAGVVISGVSDISFFGMGLSHILISYIVMSIARASDIAISGTGSLLCGMVCSLNEVASVTLIGFYGMAGILASIMRSFGKYGVVLGFLSTGAIVLLYVGNSFQIPVSILEMVISCVIFLCVPEKIHSEISGRIGGVIASRDIENSQRTADYIDEKLIKVSEAFSALADTFRAVSDKRLRRFHREAVSIVQETVERVCKNCANCNTCWKESFGVSWKYAFSLLDTYEKQGFCTVKNVSSDFLNYCIIPEHFLAEFNHSYELYRLETIHKGEAILSRDLISEQYELFSDVAKNLAKRLGEGFSSDEETAQVIYERLSEEDISVRDLRVMTNNNSYEIYLCAVYNHDVEMLCDMIGEIIAIPVFFEETMPGGVLKFSTAGVYKTNIGVSQVPKHGENVCGDSVFRFKTDANKYYIIICDGMGSGPSARTESILTGSLIQRFLEAGLPAQSAIKMVNSSLALKQESETFCTVDMAEIDLVSGRTEFYKIGGTKSFIRHDDDVDSVFLESLPLGLIEGVSCVSVTKTLGDDDVLVMMSDGVSDTEFGVFTGERMKKLLTDEEKSPDELAGAILASALKRRNHIAHDDMTVVALQLKKAV